MVGALLDTLVQAGATNIPTLAIDHINVGPYIRNTLKADKNATREDALEIIVQLRNGERRAIIQAKGNESFNSGDPVVLVTTGGKTRVTRAPAVTAPAPAPASNG